MAKVDPVTEEQVGQVGFVSPVKLPDTLARFLVNHYPGEVSRGGPDLAKTTEAILKQLDQMCKQLRSDNSKLFLEKYALERRLIVLENLVELAHNGISQVQSKRGRFVLAKKKLKEFFDKKESDHAGQ